MLRLITVFMLIVSLSSACKAQTPQHGPEHQLDPNLIGVWEADMGNNEYIQIDIYELETGYGAGNYKRFTKNPAGNLDQIIYDSSIYSIPNGALAPMIVIAQSETSTDIVLGRTSFGEFRDFGVTHQNVHDKLLHDHRRMKLRIFKDCSTCSYKMEFKFTSKKLFEEMPGTQFASNFILTKIS